MNIFAKFITYHHNNYFHNNFHLHCHNVKARLVLASFVLINLEYIIKFLNYNSIYN